MRILVDGDACPNKTEIAALAKKYHIPMLVYIDYAHELVNDFYEVIQCAIGHDSVDLVMIKDVQVGDIAITQDYGLASLLLAKGATVIHPKGMIIDEHNIDSFLMSRFIAAKQRKARQRLKGPSARTKEDCDRFLDVLEKTVIKTSDF